MSIPQFSCQLQRMEIGDIRGTRPRKLYATQVPSYASSLHWYIPLKHMATIVTEKRAEGLP